MEVHKRMLEAGQRLKEYENLKRRQKSASAMAAEASKKRDECKKIMLAEGRDLERLDGIGLLNLWHSLRGTKEEVKRKEELEYLDARIRYDQAEAALEALEAELLNIKEALASFGDPEQEFQQALQAKKEFLMSSDGPAAENIFRLDEQLGNMKAQHKEVVEALEVGQTAYKALSKVKNSLNSAGGWGALDILGGGLIVTAVKHSHINDARKDLDKAQVLLRQFHRELLDIDKEESIDIGVVSTAADFLLDGLLFDLIVQSQISTARKRTQQTSEKVSTALKELRKMLTKNEQQIDELTAERNQLIETS